MSAFFPGTEFVLSHERLFRCAPFRGENVLRCERISGPTLEEKKLRWVAGITVEDAVETSRLLNRRGIWPILNKLGEHHDVAEKAQEDTAAYLALLDGIHNGRVNATISVKPTQLGLSVSPVLLLENFEQIVSLAESYSIRVALDVENSTTYDETLKVFISTLSHHRNIQLAVQMSRRDSMSVLKRILEGGGTARICKGAYNEFGGEFFDTKEETTANFRRGIELALEMKSKSALATQDMDIVHSFLQTGLEFQILYGSGAALEDFLLSKGELVAEYVPYGDKWLPYCSRREKWFKELM